MAPARRRSIGRPRRLRLRRRAAILRGKKIIAIIPARAGSKRLPGKNKKVLAGKPLIQWTIEAAQQADYIDEIVVSTDCKEIQNLAKSLGVDDLYTVVY